MASANNYLAPQCGVVSRRCGFDSDALETRRAKTLPR
jgi:hypothetical protein